MLGTYYHPLVITRLGEFIDLWQHNFGRLFSVIPATTNINRSNSICGSPRGRVVSRTSGIHKRV